MSTQASPTRKQYGRNRRSPLDSVGLHSILAVAAFIAATQSPTRPGSRIRQAPKRPLCTRSDGQPQLRLISS